MSIRPTLILTLVLLVFGVSKLRAQNRFFAGTLPAVNLNVGLENRWSVNFKGESRQLYYQKTYPGEAVRGFQYVLFDFAFIVGKKVGLNNALAAGYLLRFREGAMVHRAIQQFTLVGLYSRFRLAHRFAADQTFSPQELPEYRMRYRITAEIPLEGEDVDPKEWYFKVNNEYLNTFQGRAYDLEFRLVPLLGYAFSDRNKLEMGLDYRMDSFLKGEYRGVIWGCVSWYVKFD